MSGGFSTFDLYNCTLEDKKVSSEFLKLSENELIRSLNLLSTVIKVIEEDVCLSERAIKYLKKFDGIKSFNGRNLPPMADKHWNIEEITILIIMLRTATHKRYDSMRKTVRLYMGTGKVPTNKVLKLNLDWLLEAYKCLGLLKYNKWSEKINEDMLQITTWKSDIPKARENIKKVEIAIEKSGCLEEELDSVIGQILAKCAYPELINENRIGYDEQLVEAVSEVIFALERIEGALPQMIAINESIKQLRKIKEDIGFSYNISKVYADKYWENVLIKTQDEDAFKEIKKTITEKYQVEFDTIRKNTM